jgi:flagellar protein FlaJ
MILFMILFLFTPLSFLVSLAMGMTPMMIPGVMAIQYESKVERRDKQFPVFVRVLGSAIEVRDGAVVSSLKSTQIHEFGALNTLAIALYRRLRVGSDRWESWYYFALESGSTMISNFSKIFSESVYMGGESQRIGELVSTSSQELLSLRKLRGQVANGLRGSFYGTLIGLSSVIYITAKVAELLIGIFSQPLTSESGDLGFAQNVLPQAESINFTVILAYISALIVLHSAASSFIMKAIDGGSWYAGIVDFIIMIWIGALLSMFLPFMVDQLLPNVEDLTVAANATG